MLELIIDTLDEHKAHNIQVLDFKNENPLCDYFVICDGSSLRQIQSLADYLEKELAKAKYPIRNIERESKSSWILIDAYDVVVHIFLEEMRDHYQLEKLYQDYAKDVLL